MASGTISLGTDLLGCRMPSRVALGVIGRAGLLTDGRSRWGSVPRGLNSTDGPREGCGSLHHNPAPPLKRVSDLKRAQPPAAQCAVGQASAQPAVQDAHELAATGSHGLGEWAALKAQLDVV
jgi:hypothetical protein